MSIKRRPPSIKALQAQLKLPNVSFKKRSELLAELAWELRRQDTQESLVLAEQAFELADTLKHKKGLAASLLARGFARSRLADYEAAQQDAQKAYDMFEALNDGIGSFRALNLLGVTYGQLGDFSKALRTFLETHMLCEMLGDASGAAAALNNAALSHTYLSDYASALELHSRALKLYESLTDQAGMVRTLANIATAYMELKRFYDALESFEKALLLQDSAQDTVPDKHVHANILMMMGRCYFELGDLTKALRYALNSQSYFESLADTQGVSQTLVVQGLIALKNQDLNQAVAAFHKALEIARTIKDRLCEVQACLELAQVYKLKARIDKAETLLLEGLIIAEAIESKAEIYRVHLGLAELYEASQNFEKAFYHHKSFAAIKDEVFNASSDQKLQSLRVSYQVEQTEREREIYKLKNVELARVNKQLKDLNQSLKKLDRQKTSLLTQLERQALEDPLTGLFNRRYFDQQTKILFAEAQTEKRLLSIMICDVDNFKTINDSFSHQMGDEVLIKLSELLRIGIRQADVLARYGGEEFILAMPDATKNVALAICERLRASIEVYPWANLHPELRVTLSIGVASELSLANVEKMISLADAKLYEAKRKGKNQVCV